MLTLYGKRLTKHIELFDEIVIMNLKLLTNRHCLQEWLIAISLQKIMIHCLLEIFTNRLTNRHKHTIPCRTPHFLELSQHASLASKLGSCSAVLVLVVSHMNVRVSHKVSISKKPFVMIEDMFILEKATSYFCIGRSALKRI